MGRLLRQIAKDVQGLAAVEFAFVAPVMVLFVVAVMEIGRLFLVHNAMTFAVDETARAAMVRKTPTATELSNLARTYAPMLESNRTTVAVNFQQHDNGRYTDISMTYQFHLMVNVVDLAQFNLVRSVRVNRRDSF